MKNFVCELNNRNGSYTLTAYGDLILPVNYIDFNLKLIYRSANKVLLNITVEFCSSFGSFPPYLVSLFDVLKKYTKDFIHPCPYKPTKEMGIHEYPFEKNFASLSLVNFPRGDYLSIYNCNDRKGKLIFFFKTFSTISNKRVFKKG